MTSPGAEIPATASGLPETGLTRRGFLTLGFGVLLAGAGVTELANVLLDSDSPPHEPANPNIGKVNQIVAKGLNRWLHIVLAPAFVVVGPNTRFFQDPSLTMPTVSPLSGSQSLGIQRPFLVSETLALNYAVCNNLGLSADSVARNNPLRPATLAFLSPDNQQGQYLYTPFDAEAMQVYLRDSYDLGGDVPAAVGLPGQQAFIDGRHHYGNQAVPYLQNDSNFSDRYVGKQYRTTETSEYRLCAVSGVYAGNLDARADGDFYARAQTSSPANDPIFISGFQRVTHGYFAGSKPFDFGC